MKLIEQQFIFSRNINKLMEHIFVSGFYCTVGEFFRTPEQAMIYAHKGNGIINSLHCKRLAADLNIFSPNGTYLTNSEDYASFGKYWKSLHPSNRWGGDFKNLPDGNHFSMTDGITEG